MDVGTLVAAHLQNYKAPYAQTWALQLPFINPHTISTSLIVLSKTHTHTHISLLKKTIALKGRVEVFSSYTIRKVSNRSHGTNDVAHGECFYQQCGGFEERLFTQFPSSETKTQAILSSIAPQSSYQYFFFPSIYNFCSVQI